MSYHMNAEGVNGVNNPTTIVNIGLSSSANPPSLLAVDALQGEDPLDFVAVQCRGSGKGAGVVGMTSVPFGGGLGGGVGVAGFSQMALFPTPPPQGETVNAFNGSFELVVDQVAGVFGMCQAGPGVAAEGADAVNPPNTLFSSTPLPAGFGVLATGGNSCAATTVQNIGRPGSETFPASASGAGLVAVAGDTAVPQQSFTTGTGVVGLGGGNTNGFPAGRGGIFGSCGKIEPSGEIVFSTGNIAQLQLIPTDNPSTVVPSIGRVGDLYVTVANGTVSMFLCIFPSQGQGTPAKWTQIQTSGTFTA